MIDFSLTQWIFILSDLSPLTSDLIEAAMTTRNSHVRSLAAMHPSMTLPLLQTLLNDEDWYVRRIALESPCLRFADLEYLMHEHHFLDVRERALELFLALI